MLNVGKKQASNVWYTCNCSNHSRLVFVCVIMQIVKFTHCPTILTRSGDRVRSNGKFGGLMNRALPLDKLRGAVFGEPIAHEFHVVVSHIGILADHRLSVGKN